MSKTQCSDWVQCVIKDSAQKDLGSAESQFSRGKADSLALSSPTFSRACSSQGEELLFATPAPSLLAWPPLQILAVKIL